MYILDIFPDNFMTIDFFFPTVVELEVKNVELEVVNQHQRCIIKDSQQTIALLRREIINNLSQDKTSNQSNYENDC